MRAWVLCTLLAVLGCGGGSSPTEPSGSGITLQISAELIEQFNGPLNPVIQEVALLYDGVEKARFNPTTPVNHASFRSVTIANASRGEHTLTLRVIRHRTPRGSTNLYAGIGLVEVQTRSGQEPSKSFGFGRPAFLSAGGEISARFTV